MGDKHAWELDIFFLLLLILILVVGTSILLILLQGVLQVFLPSAELFVVEVQIGMTLSMELIFYLLKFVIVTVKAIIDIV